MTPVSANSTWASSASAAAAATSTSTFEMEKRAKAASAKKTPFVLNIQELGIKSSSNSNCKLKISLPTEILNHVLRYLTLSENAIFAKTSCFAAAAVRKQIPTQSNLVIYDLIDNLIMKLQQIIVMVNYNKQNPQPVRENQIHRSAEGFILESNETDINELDEIEPANVHETLLQLKQLSQYFKDAKQINPSNVSKKQLTVMTFFEHIVAITTLPPKERLLATRKEVISALQSLDRAPKLILRRTYLAMNKPPYFQHLFQLLAVEKALFVANAAPNEQIKSDKLSRIPSMLVAIDMERALDIAHSISDERIKSDSLRLSAMVLAGDIRSHQRALSIANSIPNEKIKSQTLMQIAQFRRELTSTRKD